MNCIIKDKRIESSTGSASYATLIDSSLINNPLYVYPASARHSTLKLEWMTVVRLIQDDSQRRDKTDLRFRGDKLLNAFQANGDN